MKRIIFLFTALLVCFQTFSQLKETFSDDDLTQAPQWYGKLSSFIVNSQNSLQLNISIADTSFLSTASKAIKNAQWEADIYINYNPSSANYACYYLTASNPDLTHSYGYYVQVGNTPDEVSLYRQDSTTKTKIIDGLDKRVNLKPVGIHLRITRDSLAQWSLYSKLPTDTAEYLEGTVIDSTYTTSAYAGILCKNSATQGKSYIFDNIEITGDYYRDRIAPSLIQSQLLAKDSMLLVFSEAMDFSHTSFFLDNGIGFLPKTRIADDLKSIVISFPELERGKTYQLTYDYLTDFAGNDCKDSIPSFYIQEVVEMGDLIINEVLFNAADSCEEFIEIYNTSNKSLSLANLSITTRKSDGSLNKAYAFAASTSIAPNGYLALCKNPTEDSLYYDAPENSAFSVMSSWPSLSNEGATILLSTISQDTIYDELTYSPKWHNALIKNEKGVSLERINPAMATQSANSWHSASSAVNYATPGYKNSQYLAIQAVSQADKAMWVEQESFSPDNDGYQDVLLLHYALPEAGWLANITIFDADGEVQAEPFSSYLLSTSGVLQWDGSTNNRTVANIGIYVLFVELYNTQLGSTKRYKIPVVLTGR